MLTNAHNTTGAGAMRIAPLTPALSQREREGMAGFAND